MPRQHVWLQREWRAALCHSCVMVDWVRVGADLEEMATRSLKAGKRATGILGPMSIQPYRGFVSDGVAHVRARVMERPLFNASAGSPRIDSTLAANLMRWVVLDMAGVDVEVAVDGRSVVATSNADGFVIAKVPVGDLKPGWHAVTFSARDGEHDVTANGRVVLPDPDSQIAVISDIDDTLLQTGMTDGLKAVQRTMLRDAHGRKPVPGMPSLYRGLARGEGGRPESTFFYVSSGPWNLYEMLVQFLQMRGFPRGPLFMTDWRPGKPVEGAPEGVSGHETHKRARIRRLLDAYPELEFILIGDSGERDADIYQDYLDSDPDRLRMALILALESDKPGSSTAGSGRDWSQVQRTDSVIAMTQWAQDAGLVDGLTVEEVQTELSAKF
jgi:phosphatidate phosphatase APP1